MSIQHYTGVLASVIEYEKIITDMKIGKDAIKLSYLSCKWHECVIQKVPRNVREKY